MDSPENPRWGIGRWRVWAGLLLGILMLLFAMRQVDMRGVWTSLSDIQPLFLVLTLLTVLVTPVVKAARWRVLFYPQRPAAGLVPLSSLIVIGQAVNFFVPGRWGELVRTYLGGEELGIGKSYVLGTIAAEKLLDLVMLALLAAVLVPMVALDRRTWQSTSAIVAAVAVVLVVGLFLAGRRVWLRWAEKVLVRFSPAAGQRWQGRLQSLMDGLSVLSAARAAPAIWGWTLVCWLLAGLTNWFLLMAFGLAPDWLAAMFVLVVLQGGVAVPTTPGKIGVFQYLCVAALAVFGVDAAVGFGYGLVLYALIVGVMAVWAALALWQRSWGLQRWREASAGLTGVSDRPGG
jgi:uncharacterized protein (TIRG00374 family)